MAAYASANDLMSFFLCIAFDIVLHCIYVSLHQYFKITARCLRASCSEGSTFLRFSSLVPYLLCSSSITLPKFAYSLVSVCTVW